MFLNKHVLASMKVFVVFLATFFVPSAFCLDSYAATYSTSITTSGDVSIDVAAANDGASISTDTLNIVSTCPSGYEVLISGLDDTTLYKDGDSSNTVATRKISASSGTPSAPRGILGTDSTSGTSNINTWGYSVADNTTIHSASFVGLTSELVPLITSNVASAASGDNLTVYYGVSVDATIESGIYSMAETSQGANDNVITYALVTLPSCMNYSVVFSPTSTAGGQTLSGTGTMGNQSIREDLPTALSAVGFTAPTGYVFDNWNTAQDGTGTSYDDGESVTNLTTAGSSITLYAQWKLASKCAVTPVNTICYEDNGANSPTGMGNQTVSSGATDVVLWASNFQRPGYGFAGWSKWPDAADYLDPMIAKPLGFKIFGPNETINYQTETSGSPDSGLTLYAVWVEAEKDENDEIVYFYDTGYDYCANNMKLGEVKALTDNRDDETYAIAKLADGNCWMIENLRLADQLLTTNDTNNPFYTGKFKFVAINNSDGTVTEHLSASVDPTQTAWCASNTSDCIDKSMLYAGNTLNNTNMSSADGDVYSYGNYYNWYSATAGRGTFSVDQNNDSASGDICPLFWHLPRGGDKGNEANNDFWNLIVVGINNGVLPANYDSNNEPYYSGASENATINNLIRSFPNNFVNSGYARESSVNLRGRSGTYWSSTTYGSTRAYRLDFDLGYVTPSTKNYYKYSGYSVRCMMDG